MYHTTTRLEEDINKVVDTGEYNVILNSRATDFSTVSTEVKAFLEYVRDNKVTDDFTKSLDKEVVKIKSSTEVRESFMTWEEKLAEVEYYAGKKERKHNIINSIKKLDKKGYNKEKIIDTLTAVTDFTEEEISRYYNELLANQK